MAPKVTNFKRHAGIAGNYSVSATVEYDGEPAETVTFSASVYGSPGAVVMITPSGGQTFVTDPGRCGSVVDESWVRNFFG